MNTAAKTGQGKNRAFAATLLTATVLTLALPGPAFAAGEPPELPFVPEVTITGVTITQTPRVDANRMIYTMDLSFSERPRDYWAYYDGKAGAIVLDFYGISLKSLVSSPPLNKIFTSLVIKNLESEMSLSGKRALILVGCDAGWHFDATTQEKQKTVRLTIWRELTFEKPARNRSWIWAVVLGSAAAVGLAVGLTALLAAD